MLRRAPLYWRGVYEPLPENRRKRARIAGLTQWDHTSPMLRFNHQEQCSILSATSSHVRRRVDQRLMTTGKCLLSKFHVFAERIRLSNPPICPPHGDIEFRAAQDPSGVRQS